jgi:hypothetical protein
LWRQLRVFNKCYSIQELDERVRDAVFDKMRYDPDHWDCHDSEICSEDAKRTLERFGYENQEVSWSAGFCQGDYFNFAGGTVRDQFVIRRVMGKRARRMERFFKKRGRDLYRLIGISVNAGYRGLDRNSREIAISLDEQDLVVGGTFIALADSGRKLEAHTFTTYNLGSGLARELQHEVEGNWNRWGESEEDPVVRKVRGFWYVVKPVTMNDFMEKFISDLEAAVEADCDRICRNILDDIHDEIMYKSSDEYLAEECEGRDLWFDKEGEEVELPHGYPR